MADTTISIGQYAAYENGKVTVYPDFPSICYNLFVCPLHGNTTEVFSYYRAWTYKEIVQICKDKGWIDANMKWQVPFPVAANQDPPITLFGNVDFPPTEPIVAPPQNLLIPVLYNTDLTDVGHLILGSPVTHPVIINNGRMYIHYKTYSICSSIFSYTGTFDLRALSELVHFEIWDTSITSVDVRGCSKLFLFKIYNVTALNTDMDLSNQPTLQTIEIINCRLKSINISNSPAIKTINVNYNNGLPSSSVDHIINTIAAGSVNNGTISYFGCNPPTDASADSRTILRYNRGWAIDGP